MSGTGSTGRYGAASLCLGLIAVWGSENLFWTVPATPLRPWEWLATWLAYSIAAAAALSAVLWSGLGGWRAAFLGGAILGWCVEGVVVATMYDAFPLQIVWTALAWHALVTGLAVLWLPRVLAGGGTFRHIPAMAALGLFGAVWGLYWPAERDRMPGHGTAFAYLAGLGVTVVLAQAGLDRIGPLTAPRPAVLLVAPVLVAAGWMARLALTPAPALLAFPVMVAATVWIMARLGRRGAALSFGPPLATWRHGLFLVAPMVAAGLVVPAWGLFGAVAVNSPVAVGSGLTGLGLWLWLLAGAVRAGRA